MTARILRDEIATTKRSALSQLAKVYDPLCLVSPATLVGKMLFRQICKNHHAWEGELPEAMKKTSLGELVNTDARALLSTTFVSTIPSSYISNYPARLRRRKQGQCVCSSIRSCQANSRDNSRSGVLKVLLKLKTGEIKQQSAWSIKRAQLEAEDTGEVENVKMELNQQPNGERSAGMQGKNRRKVSYISAREQHLHEKGCRTSASYNAPRWSSLNHDTSLRTVLGTQWTFPLSDKILKKNRNRQKYHHSLKEHPTFTKIAKSGL